jgi:hypothetical protein
MNKEEKNSRERERHREKMKDAEYKENKRKRDLEYYHKNKKDRVEKQIQHRRNLLNEAKEKLGGECLWCKTKENLEFDHIDDAIKSENVGNAVRNTRKVFWEEVEKCQLLCKNCHNKKTTAQKRAKQKLWLSLPLDERDILMYNEMETLWEVSQATHESPQNAL